MKQRLKIGISHYVSRGISITRTKIKRSRRMSIFHYEFSFSENNAKHFLKLFQWNEMI